MDPILLYSVTLFGFMLSVLCFVVIFLGKRIPGDTGAAQELEIKGFKLKTNVVVMLLTVSAAVTILPLSLQAWLKSIETRNVDATAQLLTAAAKPQDLKIFITGQVLDQEGPIEGAKVSVINLKDMKSGGADNSARSVVTDSSGSFDFPPLQFESGDRYKVVAAKEGHVEQYFYMGPSGAVDVRTVLVAKRKNGGGS